MRWVLADFLVIGISIGKTTLMREGHTICIVLLDELESIIFVSAVGTLFLILELDGVLTVLCEELAYAAGVIAVQFVIIGKTQELC